MKDDQWQAEIARVGKVCAALMHHLASKITKKSVREYRIAEAGVERSDHTLNEIGLRDTPFISKAEMT
jgi:hypothetical protein